MEEMAFYGVALLKSRWQKVSLGVVVVAVVVVVVRDVADSFSSSKGQVSPHKTNTFRHELLMATIIEKNLMVSYLLERKEQVERNRGLQFEQVHIY